MKFKDFIGKILKGLQSGISRFAYAFLSSVALWAVISYNIIIEDFTKFSTALCFGLVFGMLLSVLIVLTLERLGREGRRLLYSLISIVPSAACVAVIYNKGFDDAYLQMGYFGLITAFVSLIVFVLCYGRKKETIAGHLIKSAVVSCAISGILCAGLSVCIAAVDYLIFGFSNIYKVYAIVNFFILLVAGINLFLSYIPEKGDDITLPKIFKVLVLYIALPVYLLLIAILYIYFIKILVTWHLPSGEINWFASYASLFFVFFLFCLRPYEEKLAVLFKKYAAYFIIPVIAIQTFAIYIRINAYGFTTPRFVSVVLVLISLLFALFQIIWKKPEKVFFAAASITLIVTLTPFNIIDVPKNDQIGRLHAALVRNNMLDTEKNEIIPNPNAAEEDREMIIGSYSYLLRAAGKKPDYIDKLENKYDYEKIFGFEERAAGKNIYCYYSSEVDFDISEYSHIKRVFFGNKRMPQDEQPWFDVPSIIENFYDEYGSNHNKVPIMPLDNEHALIIESLDATLSDTGEIIFYNLSGYILTK